MHYGPNAGTAYTSMSARKGRQGKLVEATVHSSWDGCAKTQLHRSWGREKDLEGSWAAQKRTSVVAATLWGITLHGARNQSHCQREPPGKHGWNWSWSLLPSTLPAGGGEEGRNQDRKCLRFYLITVDAIDSSSLVESQGKRARWQES